LLVGRVFSQQREDGWDAWFARVGRQGGALMAYRLVDIDRGDVLFDIAPLPQGGFLAAGATGYTQNANGASISESAMPLLATLNADGTLRQRLSIAAGPRQNQIRSLAMRNNTWVTAGLVNGPGTHSGDGDPALIVADGVVREIVVSGSQ